MLPPSNSIDRRLQSLLKERGVKRPWWENPETRRLLGPKRMAYLDRQSAAFDRKLPLPPLPQSKFSGTVYFLEAGGFIKIGFSSAVKRRIQALATGSPHDAVLIGTMRGNVATEKALHAQFDAYRRRGEWFEKGPALMEFIGHLEDRSQ